MKRKKILKEKKIDEKIKQNKKSLSQLKSIQNKNKFLAIEDKIKFFR